MIGKTVSHYKILEKLGGGGMGVVYKAEDTKLERHVALKFLPPELTRDEEAKERFIHEAKSASSLDHANICTIHEINETDDGQTFIAMAYCEGETLKQRIARGPLPAPEAVEIAIQIAEGLAKAHEKEIVHRDIKPANVMLVEDGKVKIVDFGLAKMAGVSKITKAGTTLGTVSYMSPEQARGDPVDHRADIWALGVVFYEMLTGQTPFKGEYEQAVLYSILNTEPEPVTTFQPDLPFEVVHLINKALEKDPKDRYQSVNGMLVDLQRLKRDTSKVVQVPPPGIAVPGKEAAPATTTVIPGPVKRARGLSPLHYIGAAALVVLLGVAGYFILRGIGGPPRPQFATPTRITIAAGIEDYPAWSPDGGRLVYQSNQSGNWDIWVKQVKGGGSRNLTADYEGFDALPSWSPDGSQIAFWSNRDGGWWCFVMPSLGGPARKVAEYPSTGWHGSYSPPCWSSDGQELACVVWDSDATAYFIEIIPLKGGDPRRLRAPVREGEMLNDLSWSPGRRYLAYVSAGGDGDGQLWLIRTSDEVSFPVTTRETLDRSPCWSGNEQYLYYVSTRGGTRDLWRQRLGSDGSPKDSPQSLTTGIEMKYTEFSSDGSKLVYSKLSSTSNIWRVPIPAQGAPPATWADAQQLTTEETYTSLSDISPNGERLVCSSDRDGERHLWIMPVDGGEMRRLTAEGSLNEMQARWSPDGRKIVYRVISAGNRDIWVTPVDYGQPRRLTNHEAWDSMPVWSPDGQEIAFQSDRSGNFDIWIIPAEGGEARQLTHHPAQDWIPDWSPDGKWILFSSMRDGENRIWKVPPAGGSPKPVTEGPVWGGVWSPDGKKIYFLSGRTGLANFWEVSAEGGTERQLTDLEAFGGLGGGGAIGGLFVPKTDGRYLYFTRRDDSGDLWVMDVEWE